jgi:hypothetical protein
VTIDDDNVNHPRRAWSVVVVYEDPESRQEAVRFCDQLVGEMWGQNGLEVGWWSFASLAEAMLAGEATAKAIVADVIVFATQPDGELPMPVKSWVESWVNRRGEREGTLFGLLEPNRGSASACAADKFAYLRSAAHRAGLDYLTQVGENLWHSIPDSIESFSERAEQMTDLLDDILRHWLSPPAQPD